MTDAIAVEVIYALRQRQASIRLALAAGSTVSQAIEASGLLQKFPEINLAENKVGIFGRIVDLDTALRDRDRVEIYRPLIADPMLVRKKRAAAGKGMRKGKSAPG